MPEAVNITLAHTGDDPTELVELVLEPDARRGLVKPGDTLAGRYVVLEEVSHCGMGLVYKALDRRREKAGLPVPWVALKFARESREDETATSSHLRQEFLKLSQLNHPNIVSVFDFDSHEGVDFIVMEWLEGETLADLLMHITSKRVALHKAEEVVCSVGRALAHAHDHGIVHGDVKPSNIFLTKNRFIKLLDFGSSGATAAGGESEHNWATRAYASCEVLEGSQPQPQDDLFALGVTAYCLLSGDRPFGSLDALDARQQNLRPYPLPQDARERWLAIDRALQFDRDARPASVAEFLAEFREPPADSSAGTPERSQLEHIAYGAIAVALLIALVAWTVGSVGGLPEDEQVALANAETALADGRLVEPRNDSAATWFASALEVSPENTRALDGLSRIAEHYLTLSREALAADKLDAATGYLATARQVMPDHYGIAVTEDLVARYGKDLLLRAGQLGQTDIEQAEQLVKRAEALLPADDPGVVATRAELARYRLEQQLESLLQRIDQRILAERLTLPQGDSAVDLLQEARRLAPEDRQVRLAGDRVATALLFQSMFAISNGGLDDAERFIDAAQALNVKHLALARAKYELAKARRAARRSGGNAAE